jgi:hypothetical protein
MSMNAMSSNQYGGMQSGTPAGGFGGPVTHSASTMGSIGAKTAWSTAGISGASPAAYSKRTKGSTLSWDDDGGGFQMPQSDSGSPYMQNRG